MTFGPYRPAPRAPNSVPRVCIETNKNRPKSAMRPVFRPSASRITAIQSPQEPPFFVRGKTKIIRVVPIQAGRFLLIHKNAFDTRCLGGFKAWGTAFSSFACSSHDPYWFLEDFIKALGTEIGPRSTGPVSGSGGSCGCGCWFPD